MNENLVYRSWTISSITCRYQTKTVIHTQRSTLSVNFAARGSTSKLINNSIKDSRRSLFCQIRLDRIDCINSMETAAAATVRLYIYKWISSLYYWPLSQFNWTIRCAILPTGQYSLPLGVFLFVGYSRADEKAIYQFTHTNVSRSLLAGLHRLMYISLPESVSYLWWRHAIMYRSCLDFRFSYCNNITILMTDLPLTRE